MQILRFSWLPLRPTQREVNDHVSPSPAPAGEFFEETNASVQIWRRGAEEEGGYRGGTIEFPALLVSSLVVVRRRVSQEKTSSERGHARRKNNNKSGGGDETWVRLDA